MPRKLVNLRLPEELLTRVDAAAQKAGQTRTKFVERALAEALSVPKVGPSPTSWSEPLTDQEIDRVVADERLSPEAKRSFLERHGVRASSLVKRDVKPIPKK